MKKIRVGSDFSVVGAFDYAMKRVAFKNNFMIETVYSCDWDKYARISYAAAHGEPAYFPKDVYEREIPKDSLDIYMTSPPCQAFSLAGKRAGKDDLKGRGILFFNSLEFIQKNKPRFFIFENVKGLLSDDSGKTFQEWVNYLGGKSVNGLPILFPETDSVPYHLYWQVLNTKNHGVPQNRERVFLIGIRDDSDNNFTFPKDEPLTKRLKDVLEKEVDKKYFLSEKMISGFMNHNDVHNEKGTGFIFKPKDSEDVANALRANAAICPTDNTIKVETIKEPTFVSKEVRTDEAKKQRKQTGTNDFRGKEIEFREQEFMNTITTGLTNDHFILEQDLKIGTWRTHKDGQGFREIEDGNCPTIPARAREDGSGQPVIKNQDYKIRRLTPLECFRLQDFPDVHVELCKNSGISDSQLYKQAGNSITVRVLQKIIERLKL